MNSYRHKTGSYIRISCGRHIALHFSKDWLNWSSIIWFFGAL